MKRIFAIVCCVAMLLGCLVGCGTAGENDDSLGTVYIYCFGDYFDPELEYSFEEATGYDAVIDYFDTNEELYPVIKNQTIAYDVICASDYMIAKLAEEGLLAEIDFANVPNAEYIMDNIKPLIEEFDPGMKYSIPHTWGTYGIMYNTDMIDEVPTSWSDLWNEEYEGQIVMPNSIREAFMIAGKVLGYSMNTTSESELQEMTELLIKQKPLIYSLANDDAREYMIGESAALAVVNSGEVLYSQDLNENLGYVVPTEGTEVWTDCWAITNAAGNKEGAEAWLNYMLEGDVAELNFEYLTYAIPNSEIADIYEDAEVLNPSQELLQKCQTLKNLGSEVDELYSKYWKEYKAM